MNIKKKLYYLNINYKIYTIIHIASSLLVFIFFLIISPYKFIVAPLVAVAYYLIFNTILIDWKLNEIINNYEYDSVQFFNNFLILLKNGYSIKEAIIKTSNIENNELTSLVIKELKNNKITLEERIKSIINHIPSDIVCNMFTEVLFAYQNGNNLGDGIKRQIESLKEKYDKNTINYYKFIPVKISLICIVTMLLMALVLIIST